MKNVVILNFTGLRGNWGCQATSFELLNFINGLYPSHEDINFDIVPLLATTELDTKYDSQLDRVYDSFEDVAANTPSAQKSLDYLTEIGQNRYAKWVPILKNADLVVFQAEGSMGMGEDFAKGPRLMLLPFVAKHAWNRTVIALNQSFYSHNADVLRNAALTFNSLDFCSFRESLSLAFAKENGVTQAKLIPDLAFQALSWDPEIQARKTPPETFAITGTALKDPNRYKVITEQAKTIAQKTGLKPVIAVSRDYQLTLTSGFSLRKYGVRKIPRQSNYAQVTKEFSQNAFLIGGRYHMSILASAALTPSILYQGNTFKNEGLAHLVNNVRPVRSFSDTSNIMKDIEDILNNYPAETQNLTTQISKIRHTINTAQSHLFAALNDNGDFNVPESFQPFNGPTNEILGRYHKFGRGKLKKRSKLGLTINALGERFSKPDQSKLVNNVLSSLAKSGDDRFKKLLNKP